MLEVGLFLGPQAHLALQLLQVADQLPTKITCLRNEMLPAVGGDPVLHLLHGTEHQPQSLIHLRIIGGGGLHNLSIECDGLDPVSDDVQEAHLVLDSMRVQADLHLNIPLSLLACSNMVLSLASLPNTARSVHMSKIGTPGRPAPGTTNSNLWKSVGESSNVEDTLGRFRIRRSGSVSTLSALGKDGKLYNLLCGSTRSQPTQ